MTDAANGHANDAASPEIPQTAPGFAVNAQYVRDLSFENPGAPESLINQKSPPEVSVQVNVGARGLMQDVYEVVLSISATAKQGEQTAFIAEVTYGGVFSTQNVPPEHLQPLLLIECPRFLFPFARAIIANATREGGFPPLLIQPIDFVELFRRNAEAAAT